MALLNSEVVDGFCLKVAPVQQSFEAAARRRRGESPAARFQHLSTRMIRMIDTTNIKHE